MPSVHLHKGRFENVRWCSRNPMQAQRSCSEGTPGLREPLLPSHQEPMSKIGFMGGFRGGAEGAAAPPPPPPFRAECPFKSCPWDRFRLFHFFQFCHPKPTFLATNAPNVHTVNLSCVSVKLDCFNFFLAGGRKCCHFGARLCTRRNWYGPCQHHNEIFQHLLFNMESGHLLNLSAQNAPDCNSEY